MTLEAAALAWQTVSGMSFGDLGSAGQENAAGHAFHRPQLRVRFREEAILVAADFQRLGDIGRALGRHHGLGQHHHVGVDLDILARGAYRRP